MKKRFALALALALLLSGCGDSSKDSGGIVPDENPTSPTESTSPDWNQTPSNPEPQPESTHVVTPLQIMKGEGSCGEWDDNYNMLCYASWEDIQLIDDCPELRAALDNLNVEQSVDAYSFVQEWLPCAEEMMAEGAGFFNGFTLSSEYTVQRADSLILSVREDFGSYTGGVHANYGAMGWNFDTATGERLGLEDILTDTDALDEILARKIREKYPDEPFDSLDLMLMDYTPENYTWTLGYQGITFYFSPYEIASFAAGLLTATIWYDEMPHLFHEEYTVAPQGGYAVKLPSFHDMEADITDAECRDTLSYVTIPGKLGEKHLVINLNGQKYPQEDWWTYDITAYLICKGEKYYLYAESSGENDYSSLYVYDLNTGEPELLGDYPNLGFYGYWDADSDIYYRGVFNDPTRFTLSSRSNLLGTKNSWRDYEVTDHGTPAPLSKHYDLDREHFPVTTLIPLELTMLPRNTVERVPAGTDLYFLRTDNETYVDLTTEDGKEFRVFIEKIDYNPTINGIPEWDCFDNLLYAG